MSLDIIEAVAGLPALKGWDGLGMAVQAYGKRARPTIAWADALGARDRPADRGRGWSRAPIGTARSSARRSRGCPTIRCSRARRRPTSPTSPARSDMLAAKNIYPAFATHNALTVATILEWAGDSRDFEFQRLHGMGEGLYESLVREQGYHTRIYAPVGGHRDLLAYLVRRLLENGANSSFVHQLADEKSDRRRDLLADPVAKIAAVGGTPPSRHPAARATCSRPSGTNSEGLDLKDRRELDAGRQRRSPPPLDLRADRAGARRRRSWSTRALAGFAAWSTRSVEDRAACLERLADLLERDRDMLMRIAVQEAKQDHPRRARRGARGGRFLPLLCRPGARAACSRSSFPGRPASATCCGWRGAASGSASRRGTSRSPSSSARSAAALAAGNSVVAKPAPQTPRDRRLCGRPRP